MRDSFGYDDDHDCSNEECKRRECYGGTIYDYCDWEECPHPDCYPVGQCDCEKHDRIPQDLLSTK